MRGAGGARREAGMINREGRGGDRSPEKGRRGEALRPPLRDQRDREGRRSSAEASGSQRRKASSSESAEKAKEAEERQERSLKT